MNSMEPQSNDAPATKRRWLRFGLLDLLLLTTLIGAWIPYLLARRQFRPLENKIASLRQMAETIVVEDPEQIHVLRLRSHRYGATTWKVFVPQGEPYELRLANEGIVNSSFPSEFRRIPILPGQHRIGYFEFDQDDHENFRLFLDDDLAIETRYPKTEMPNSGGSSTSSGINLQTFQRGESVKLYRMIFDADIPGYRYRSAQNDGSLPSQGAVVWLAPVSKKPTPPTTFVPNSDQPSYNQGWGFREGIRVNVTQSRNSSLQRPGTLQIFHAKAFQSQRTPLNQISVRVLEQGKSKHVDSTQEPSRAYNSSAGLHFTIADNIQTPKNRWERKAGSISDDGKTYTVFFHLESFASGAAPIIEARFQQDYPNRVGFRIHNRASAPKLDECILSAKDCAFPMLRNVHFADETNSLDQLSPKWSKPENKTFEDSEWMLFDHDRFPLIDDQSLRRAQLSTNVDYPEVTNFGQNRSPWDYIGVPATQAWLFPDSKETQVALRAREVYRANSTNIPGGPAFSDFEIRTPMDSKQWIYFEVVPEDYATYKADQDAKEAKRKAQDAAKRKKAAEERRKKRTKRDSNK